MSSRGRGEGEENDVRRSLLVVLDSPKLGGRSSLFPFYSFCEIPPSFSPTKLLNPVPFSAREKIFCSFLVSPLIRCSWKVAVAALAASSLPPPRFVLGRCSIRFPRDLRHSEWAGGKGGRKEAIYASVCEWAVSPVCMEGVGWGGCK